jgi:polyhydroxyalkanoate synthesis regulator phasin
MASPSWFFSTVSQSVAAVAGFIITLVTVLHQLQYNQQKGRTDKLRESLIEFKQKYADSTLQVLELLQSPFDNEVPCELPNEGELSAEQIRKLSNDELGNFSESNKLWAYCYLISNTIKNIEPDRNNSGDYLISKSEIDDIQTAIEEIKKKLYNGDETVADEITSLSDEDDDLSPREPVFSSQDERHIHLDEWFQQHFEKRDPQYDLNGQNILSILNYFQEMEKDIGKISIKANNTAIDTNNQTDNLWLYLIALITVGVFLPIVSLITLPPDIVILTGLWLAAYELSLVVITIGIIVVLLKKVISRLPTAS